MLDSKGQESAPFVVMISVIIMVFVLAIGLLAMEEFGKTQCELEMHNTLSNLKFAIENSAKGLENPDVEYKLPSCYNPNPNESKLVIEYVDEEIICSHYCGGSSTQCNLLRFHNQEYYGVGTVCLKINPTTTFPDGAPCDDGTVPIDGDDAKYEIPEGSWENKNVITEGRYTLVNRFNVYGSSPIVCVYRKKVI
ncbi:MAG: hypothetical protein ABID38_04615 [Candidatus Diapherotrites archaeon]